MKKSIIALAIVSGSFAGIAQADGTTLYGSIRMAYTYTGKDDATLFRYDKRDRDWKKTQSGELKSNSKFADYGSRFGIRGSEDLGNGLEAFYNYENRLGDGEAKTRKLYAGLRGVFGSLSLGKQYIPRDNLTNFSDPTNKFETDYGRTARTIADNSLVYVSPNMNGFTLATAYVADENLDFNRHIDAYDLLFQYEANGFYAGLGYQSTNVHKGNDWSNLGLGFGYGNDQFEVGLLAEREDVEHAKPNPLFIRLGGLYNVTPMDAVYASVSYYDSDFEDTKKVKAATLGYQHKFSKRTRVWAEYGYRSKGTAVDLFEGKAATYEKSNSKFAVGLRTDF